MVWHALVIAKWHCNNHWIWYCSVQQCPDCTTFRRLFVMVSHRDYQADESFRCWTLDSTSIWYRSVMNQWFHNCPANNRISNCVDSKRHDANRPPNACMHVCLYRGPGNTFRTQDTHTHWFVSTKRSTIFQSQNPTRFDWWYPNMGIDVTLDSLFCLVADPISAQCLRHRLQFDSEIIDISFSQALETYFGDSNLDFWHLCHEQFTVQIICCLQFLRRWFGNWNKKSMKMRKSIQFFPYK